MTIVSNSSFYVLPHCRIWKNCTYLFLHFIEKFNSFFLHGGYSYHQFYSFIFFELNGKTSSSWTNSNNMLYGTILPLNFSSSNPTFRRNIGGKIVAEIVRHCSAFDFSWTNWIIPKYAKNPSVYATSHFFQME